MLSSDKICFMRMAQEEEPGENLDSVGPEAQFINRTVRRAQEENESEENLDRICPQGHLLNATRRDYRLVISRTLPPEDDTSQALSFCRKKIVAPFKCFQQVVGWYPLFDVHSQLRCVNCLHPTLVVLIIMSGYVIQVSTCFERFATSEHWTGNWPGCHFNQSGPLPDTGDREDMTCSHHIFSRFVVLIILHSAAYCHSFYSLRFADPEHLVALIERVFLYTTTLGCDATEREKCIRVLRWILLWSLSGVLILLIGDIVHLTCIHGQMCFTWLYQHSDPNGSKLSVLLITSFTLLNVVYVAVAANYTFQCRLLVYFTDGLVRRIRENSIGLFEAMEHVGVLSQEVSRLNKRSGVAVSLVILNIFLISVQGVTTVLRTRYEGRLKSVMYVNGTACILVWWVMIAVPLVAAARLTSCCTHLRKLGLEVRLRSPAEQETTLPGQDDAVPSSSLEERRLPIKRDSFLFFMDAMTISADLFLLPVKSGYILMMISLAAFVILFLFQSGLLHISLV